MSQSNWKLVSRLRRSDQSSQPFWFVSNRARTRSHDRSSCTFPAMPPTLIEHLHLPSSPSPHHFPHLRTHHKMKSTIVGKDAIETAAVHRCSRADQLALERSADLNKPASVHCAGTASPVLRPLPLPVIPQSWNDIQRIGFPGKHRIG